MKEWPAIAVEGTPWDIVRFVADAACFSGLPPRVLLTLTIL